MRSRSCWSTWPAGATLGNQFRRMRDVQKLSKTALLAMLLMLTGCASFLPGNDCVDFCSVAKPIYMNGSDTEQTKDAIDLHNAIWLEFCQ